MNFRMKMEKLKGMLAVWEGGNSKGKEKQGKGGLERTMLTSWKDWSVLSISEFCLTPSPSPQTFSKMHDTESAKCLMGLLWFLSFWWQWKEETVLRVCTIIFGTEARPQHPRSIRGWMNWPFRHSDLTTQYYMSMCRMYQNSGDSFWGRLLLKLQG